MVESAKGQFGEPWSDQEAHRDAVWSYADGLRIELETSIPARSKGKKFPSNEEIAHRIIACVNACDGIPTEDLEAGALRMWIDGAQCVDCGEHIAAGRAEIVGGVPFCTLCNPARGVE